MRFLLETLVTLLVMIDYAVAACGLSAPPTNNVSMCNWLGLRGKYSLFNNFWKDFSLLTLIANILHDRIFLDGGRLWYHTYGVPRDKYIYSLTIAEEMTIAPITYRLTVWATNRC